MKRVTLLLMILLSLSLWAEVGAPDGVGVNLNLNSTVYVDTIDSTTQEASLINLSLSPTLHYFLENDKDTEFIPYVTFGCQWESNPDSLSHDTTIDDEVYRITIGGGASLLWHFMKTEKIDLLTGFRGDLNYSFAQKGDNAPTGDSGDPVTTYFNAYIYIPLSIDFSLTPKITLRVSSDIIKIGYAHENESDEDSSSVSGVFDTSFPLLDDGSVAIAVAAIYHLGK